MVIEVGSKVMGYMSLTGKVIKVEKDEHNCANAKIGKLCMCNTSDWVLVDVGNGQEILYRASELTEL